MNALAKLAGQFPGYAEADLHVDIARAIVLAAIEPIGGQEQVALKDALDRVLATDILSPIDVPPVDNAAMDGYAVRASDLAMNPASTLREVGTSLAGRPWAGRLGPGECIRIMTGAAMPEGADTVVVRELARADRSTVLIPAGAIAGQNRRRAGEDLAKGKLALQSGTRIGPAELGLVASLGFARLQVRPRLRVAFFSTGDELRDVAPEDSQASGQDGGAARLFDSNRYTLHSLLTHLGCATSDLGIVADDPALIEARLRAAVANHDLVIASGGVSEGDADFTVPMMRRLGEVLHWKLAMRPGRPLAFGKIVAEGNAAWLFGLPGNPVAAMIAFIQFVRPAIFALIGQRDEALPCFSARALAPIRKKPGRTEFARGYVTVTDGVPSVTPAENQGSGILRTMAAANCLIVLGHERGDVLAGENVAVQLLAGLL